MMTLENRTATDQTSKQGEVRVNQRALVRKILSRYSSDFAVYRELLQNSDDARSDNVIIRFDETSSGIPNCTFENFGDPFTQKDWDRLTEIANGNPDSGKVGAFGVGFYSIFSMTDHPVVLSGGRKMEFHWKGRAGALHYSLSEHDTPGKGATIKMSLENTEIPKRDDLFRFLATSITFMTCLKNVEVFLNQISIGRITKYKENVEEDNKTRIEMEPVNPSDGMMRFLEPLKLQRRQFTIEYSPDPEKQPNVSSKLSLSIFSIETGVQMEQKLKEGLIQSTFKDRAPRVKYSLIYTGKEEYDQSSADTTEHGMIFEDLRADLNDALRSKIFIGHSTRQTTGIGGHMESQFIPTVERESIDLVNKNVAIWNNSLLYLGSFLSRVVYERELFYVETAWIKLQNESEAFKTPNFGPLREHFIHVLKFFTFRPSTPSPKVAEKLCESFYTCTASPLRLLSSVGVRKVSDIRLFDKLCEVFLKDVPMLSSSFSDLAVDFVRAHPDKPEIQPVTPSDIQNDLQHHPLDGSTGELISFLQWMLREWTAGIAHLLTVARFRDIDGKDIPLSSVKHFIDPKGHGSYIPLKSPLPRSVIPRRITETIPPTTMLQHFDWREFTVVDWLLYISSEEVRSVNPEYDFTLSIDWAEHMLGSVCSAWSESSLSGDVRKVAKSVFESKKCIPTTRGLCTPEESCLPRSNATEFGFPIVKFSSSREISEDMEQLLLALGVRECPPIQLFLAQEGLKTSDIVNHLVQRLRVSLSDLDTEVLRLSPVFAAKGAKEGGSEQRFRLDQLYPPTEIFQQLGLPLIDWGGNVEWQDTSREEVKLLYRLGLRRFPPLNKIIERCSKDIKIGNVAFSYLCKHLRSEYSGYNPDEFRDTAFVPAEITSGVGFRKPGEVFIDKQWGILGFPVIQHEYEKSVLELLGIQQYPPSLLILQRLTNVEIEYPDFDEETARKWFEILSHHVPRFQNNELECISRLCIVPKTTFGNKKMLTPVECYLGGSTKDNLYSKLFHFVDFGAGDKFLRVCGAKNYPTEDDIATRLVSDPQEVLDLAGWKRFLEELTRLASNPGRIRIETKCKMERQPVLLGSRPCEETGKPEKSYRLWKPNEIVIMNDMQTLQQFADSESIVTAPRDIPPELEGFYISLGCRYLTKAIEVRHNASSAITDQQMCSKYRNLVMERLPIFLYYYSHLKPGTSGSQFFGANDITVQVWQELSVSRTLTVPGKEGTKKERHVSATVIYKSNTIQLWLTRQVEKNKHDLAASLCSVFLGTENRPDVEFLVTCLGPRDVLEQRGYEIDGRSRCLEDWKLLQGAANSSITVDPMIPNHHGTKETVRVSMTKDKQPTANASPSPSIVGAQAVMGVSIAGAITDIRQSHTDLVEHQQHMESTVRAAIEACSHGGQALLNRHRDPSMMKSMANGYCDVSTSVDDLRCFCTIQNVEVHVAKDIPDDDAGSICTQELLTRFLKIIQRIAAIYGLPTQSYRIFYHAARSIAFNHRGTIYLNLHYFEKWHYENIKKGKKQRALALWFLTFAHEIAHNLVADHNSEHEFWFLAVCEAHMKKFSKIYSPSLRLR